MIHITSDRLALRAGLRLSGHARRLAVDAGRDVEAIDQAAVDARWAERTSS
jgi:hypothetical protein